MEVRVNTRRGVCESCYLCVCGVGQHIIYVDSNDFGIRCIIAPSFADIFRNNTMQNGMLPVILPEEQCRELAAEAEARDRKRKAEGKPPLAIESASAAGAKEGQDEESNKRRKLLQEALELDKDDDEDDDEDDEDDEDEPDVSDEEESSDADSVDSLHIFPKAKTVISDITGEPKKVYPEIEPDYDSDSSTEDVRIIQMFQDRKNDR